MRGSGGGREGSRVMYRERCVVERLVVLVLVVVRRPGGETGLEGEVAGGKVEAEEKGEEEVAGQEKRR